jgi:BRCA1-associated protein
MGEQKSSSRCVNTPITNREDSKINCAVCLEDLGLEEKKLDDGNALLAATDGATSAVCTPVTASHPSLLTTVCNHTFHLDCLQQCTGPCPVCRYDHSGLNETLSQCHVCRTTEHNYVCLICGVVSCGIPYTAEAVPPVAAAASSTTASTTTAPPRFYTSSHAGQHYRDTLHAYALDTETQHVYDFCGQGYVHRLVQNKEDGKLVEVNDPRQSSAVARGRTPGERSLTPGLSNAQEGEVVHRKLEGAAEQYNTLLKSQLEQQRAYYEERMNDVKREFSAEHQRTKAQDLLSVLRQERKQVTQRLSTLQRRKAKVAETVAFLTDMNESLESNKVALKHRIQQAVREQNDSKETVLGYLPELEAKLSELMKQLID